MPPKLNDGGFVPYELFFANGRPVTIDATELPPEPGWEPPDFGLHEMNFEMELHMSRRYSKSLIKAIHMAVNRQKRAVRTAKRQREKERRRRLKGVDDSGKSS